MMEQESKTQDIAPFINSNYNRAQYERWAANNLRIALEADAKYGGDDRPCLMVRIMVIVLLLGAVLGGTIAMDVLIEWFIRIWP